MVADTYPKTPMPPLERLEALFIARVSTVGERAGIARFIFSDQFALALPPAAVERMLDLVRGTRAFVLQALEEGMASGVIRKDLEPKALLHIVLGSLQHLVFLSALSPGLGKAPKATEIFASLACLLAAPSKGKR
jgi:hypothetical protein